MAMTKKLSEILNRLMFERHIRTAELARRANLPQPTVQRIVSGVTTNPHRASLQPIAEFFSVTVEQLIGREPIPWLESMSHQAAGWMKVPLLAWNQVSTWLAGNGEVINPGLVFTDAKISDTAYALRMQDYSMLPIFPVGTLLILDPNKEPRDHSYVTVELSGHGEVIFRQLLIDGHKHYLKAISADFKHVTMEQISPQHKLVGTLVQARYDFYND